MLTIVLEGALAMEPVLPCPLGKSDIAQLKNIIMHAGVDFLFYGTSDT